MACLFQPESPSEAFLGQPSLFGYINGDGRLRATNCGLAAAATLLTHQGIMQPVDNSDGNNANMQKLEAEFPPNILFGLAGTSRGRVERILDAYGLEALEVDGEAALKEQLAHHEPVAVMLQVPGQQLLGMTMPAGHWMVAYAFDSEKVYLTNWCDDGMSWDTFREGWSGVIPWCINMNRKGLCVRKW
ncbi:MAG: hypothetical protein U0796_10490 [Gemmatales bacterium]